MLADGTLQVIPIGKVVWTDWDLLRRLAHLNFNPKASDKLTP